MDQRDITERQTMIPINCRNLILKDFLNSFKNLQDYSNFIDKNVSNIMNPFVDDPYGLPVIHHGDLETIQQSNATTIVIDMITEGFNVSEHFKKYPPDKKYIFFSNGWWNTKEFNFNLDYKLIHWNYFLYDYVKRAIDYNVFDFYQDKNYIFNKSTDFLFVATIGSRKEWRDQLVDLLKKEIKFDNYVLNYSGKELGKPSRELDINYDFDIYNSYNPIFKDYSISSSIPIKLYNKSKILLVVETRMYEHNEFHLTEKTIKALLTGIPFIICGSYKFIEHLRALGFQTYNTIWSEEYDDISDIQERQLAIVNLLNHVKQMSWDQNLIDKLQLIAYHNKAQLLNVNSIMRKQLETIIKTFKDYKI